MFIFVLQGPCICRSMKGEVGGLGFHYPELQTQGKDSSWERDMITGRTQSIKSPQSLSSVKNQLGEYVKWYGHRFEPD